MNLTNLTSSKIFYYPQLNSPVPLSRILEHAILVQEDDILKAALKLAAF
ncbi:MAG: hypothetical protein HZB59_07430 [Ignavibacteriales bacterium]|nr:hypothetical protein [Ignavibacteriales bacterium]